MEPINTVSQNEPLIIRTGGRWRQLSDFVSNEFVVGKTYRVSVKGNCEFMISKERPAFGIKTNEITFTQEDGVTVWIKTGK